MIEAFQKEPKGYIMIIIGLVMIGYCVFMVIKFFSDKNKAKDVETNEYKQLLTSLSKNAKEIDVDGLPVEIRNCSDRVDGKLDPRTEETGKMTRDFFRKNRSKINPLLLPNEEHLFGPENPEQYSELEYLRRQFGWVTKNLSSGLKAKEISINTSHGEISVYKYEVPSTDKNRPCVVFFHGGGFFGGTIETVENQCKLLAELSGSVVISVDYPLAPEHPYPIGFDVCYETVEWVYRNVDTLCINPSKIAVSGDSAGGNLALICAMRARDEGKNMIAYMGLIYPTVSRIADENSEYYYFDEKAYDNPGNDPYISEQIVSIQKANALVNEWYVPKGEDLSQPYLSPITASMNGLPTALVITAEYDYLRMECEELSRKLNRSGVKARHIRYGGIVHGTFDRLGYAPQVEDMLREMAKDLRRIK